MSTVTNAINLRKVSVSFSLFRQLVNSGFPHFITIDDLSVMSTGKKVIWDSSSWRFEGWLVPAKSRITYSVTIAFHGFDRDACEMENFMPFYDDNTAMLSINLLHHGKSAPLDPLPIHSALGPLELLSAIEQKVKEEFPEAKTLELLGYSMGARITFKLVKEFPGKFNRLIALAPDGLKMTNLYKFVVHTKLGKLCWSLIDRFPKTNRRIIDALYKAGAITSHKHHFGRYHTDNSEIRRRVAYGWEGYKKFWAKPEALAHAFSQIDTTLVFGDRDKIIPEKWADELKRELGKISCSSVKFIKIESGHVMRHAATVEQIKDLIKS